MTHSSNITIHAGTIVNMNVTLHDILIHDRDSESGDFRSVHQKNFFRGFHFGTIHDFGRTLTLLQIVQPWVTRNADYFKTGFITKVRHLFFLLALQRC